jgi:hypothetical protein
MGRLNSKQHAVRAAAFLLTGAAMIITMAVGMYFDNARKMVWLWITLLVASLPAVGWGSSYLAQARGYPKAGGCGLCIVGYVVSAFLGTTSPHPLALGTGMLFIVLLPTIVLFALPNKSGHSNRRGR